MGTSVDPWNGYLVSVSAVFRIAVTLQFLILDSFLPLEEGVGLPGVIDGCENHDAGAGS